MNKLLFCILLLPSFSFACEPDFIEREFLFVSRFPESAPLDTSVEDIMQDFFPVKIERKPIAGGTLPTEVINRLATSEKREEKSHGKDSFWRTVLAQREQDEPNRSLIERLRK